LAEPEHVVGMDIGGTKMLAVVFDAKFKPVGRYRKKSKGNVPPEEHVNNIIEGAMADAGIKKVRGIGMGSPGPLDPETGVIIDTPNLGWKDFPLKKNVEKHFGVPAVVDNDVNMGTYGEWCFGEVQDCQNVLGMFPGTGIGGGIIIDGKLYHGFSGSAGEVGHMTLEVDGPYCGCGKNGCLEGLASRVAIAKEVAALALRGDAPFILENCGADLSKIRSGALARAIEAGDKHVEAVVRRAAYYVGVGVANLINVLSPEAVVMGGGLVEAMEKLYLEEVSRGVKEHAMPFCGKVSGLSPRGWGTTPWRWARRGSSTTNSRRDPAGHCGVAGGAARFCRSCAMPDLNSPGPWTRTRPVWLHSPKRGPLPRSLCRSV
jgi:glucokinase